jgi:hypothetical protein
LKPKSAAVQASVDTTVAPTKQASEHPSAATAGGGVNKGIAQSSLQRSGSGWNVWNETGSVNSDGKENISGGATLTLRADDPQVKYIALYIYV